VNGPAIRDTPPPYGTVVFDCDSTLSTIEGVDELARDVLGPEELVLLSRLTERAMEGALALEEVYGRRLELVAPTRAAVERLAERYVASALPHARELCAALGALEKRVHVVSGGVRSAILPLARWLGIPAEHVHAVDLSWDARGGYAGFDRGSPLTRSGGKALVLAEIARDRAAGPIALVGDGATDLEAAHVAARFVAFGGVARRPSVFARALVSCAEPDLAPLVPLLLSEPEIETLSASGAHRRLLSAARSHA
jgi:phosphoserine phosphatase